MKMKRTFRWWSRCDARQSRQAAPGARPRCSRRSARSAGTRARAAGLGRATRRGRRGSWIPTGGSSRAGPWSSSCTAPCRSRRRTWSCPSGSARRHRRRGGPSIGRPTPCWEGRRGVRCLAAGSGGGTMMRERVRKQVREKAEEHVLGRETRGKVAGLRGAPKHDRRSRMENEVRPGAAPSRQQPVGKKSTGGSGARKRLMGR